MRARQRLLHLALEEGDADAAAELERLARRARDDAALLVALAVRGHDGLSPWQVRDRWRTLCELLERGLAEPTAIGRALDRAWSETARTLPRRWLERLCAGTQPPLLAIVRHACVDSVDALERVLDAPGLASLTHLDLSGCDAGYASCRLLARATALTGLVDLELTATGLDDRDCEVLAEAPHLASLRRLGLGRNTIGDPGCQALARATHLERLRALDLHANEIGDPGCRALMAAPFFAALDELQLQDNRIGLATYQRLSRAKRPRPFTDLVFDFACALADGCGRDFLEELELKTLAVLALSVGLNDRVRLHRADLVTGILAAVEGLPAEACPAFA